MVFHIAYFYFSNNQHFAEAGYLSHFPKNSDDREKIIVLNIVLFIDFMYKGLYYCAGECLLVLKDSGY